MFIIGRAYTNVVVTGFAEKVNTNSRSDFLNFGSLNTFGAD